MQQTAQTAKEAVEAAAANPAVSEELKATLLEFTKSTLTAVREGASAGVDFAKEQLPLVLQEIVYAEVLSAVMWAVATIGLLTISQWLAAQCAKDDPDFNIGFYIFRVGGIVVFGGATLSHVYAALYALLFPRLTIINYLTELVNRVS